MDIPYFPPEYTYSKTRRKAGRLIIILLTAGPRAKSPAGMAFENVTDTYYRVFN